MNHNDLEWWPRQLREIFAAVGAVMGERRLTPDVLQSVRHPDNRFSISHVSGEQLARRKGMYVISAKGAAWK
jgi:hypothetical protein